MLSTADDNVSESTQADSTYHLQPVDIDKNPIILDGNPAHIEGIMFEVGKFYRRKGKFQQLLKNHAVLLSNGKLAVDSVIAVSFVSGLVKDPEPYTFDYPCPPTTGRIQLYDDAATVAATPKFKAPAGPLPDHISTQFVVSAATVEAEDAKLFQSLIQIIEDSDWASELEEMCGGSGLMLRDAILDRASKVKPKDRALVTSLRDQHAGRGVTGEMTLKTFNAYYKEFNRLERFVPPSSRWSDEYITEKLHNVMFKDPIVRDLFEMRLEVNGSSCTKLTDHVNLIREFLRGRNVTKELDESTEPAGTVGHTLMAQQVKALSALPPG